MVTRIDLTGAPAPVPTPLVTFVQAIGLGAVLGFGLMLPLALILGLLSLVVPALSPAALERLFGVSEDRIAWQVLMPPCTLVGIVMALSLFANHRWRVPVHDLDMGELSTQLRAFRRRQPRSFNRARLWGAFNYIFLFSMLIGLFLLPRVNGRPMLGEARARLPPELQAAAMWIMLIIIFGGIIFLILNGARLLSGGGSAAKMLGGIAMRAAPWAALAAIVFAGLTGTVFLALEAHLEGPAQLLAGLPVIAGLIFGFMALNRIEARLRDRADALSLPTAKDALWADRRRPVLFLRSFKDDVKYVTGAPISQGDANNWIERLEDSLAKVAGQYGPLIAVGEPGALPTTGAARAYYEGDDWRIAVTAWLDQSLFTLMIAGYTEGVRWELDTAIARGHTSKLILIFPPNDPHFEARWAWVRNRFHGHPIAAEMDKADRTGCIAMHATPRGELILIHCKDPAAPAYKAALAVAIYGAFVRPDNQP